MFTLPVVFAVLFVAGVFALFAWLFLVAEPVETKDGPEHFAHPAGEPQKRGAVNCPFCSSHIADDVAYLGQQVSCPNCHSAFKAPHWQGVSADPDFQNAMIRLIFGIISVGFGLYAMWWAYSG